MEESRREIKERMRDTLAGAEVSPRAMTALYLGLGIGLGLLGDMGRGALLTLFLALLTSLLSLVLDAGFVLYCMAVRRGQRAEFLTLFDGFDSALKIVLLAIVKAFFIFLWSMLFVIPGIVAVYRYRFALYNLLENPDIGVTEAIAMSKRQTWGWKARLFVLDLSYLPWMILAGIPQYVYNSAIQSHVQARIRVGMGSTDYARLWRDAVESINGSAYGLSAVQWELIISVWALVVGLFYLVHYECVTLEYFEAAKQASGVGEGSAPWEREDFYNQR